MSDGFRSLWMPLDNSSNVDYGPGPNGAVPWGL